MSKEKDIKTALAWVIARGYSPLLDNPEQRAEGFVADYRNGNEPCFTQLYSVVGEDVFQAGRSYSVDEIYSMFINEPRL